MIKNKFLEFQEKVDTRFFYKKRLALIKLKNWFEKQDFECLVLSTQFKENKSAKFFSLRPRGKSYIQRLRYKTSRLNLQDLAKLTLRDFQILQDFPTLQDNKTL